MDITPLILSRIQFAFTIGLHIIFPAFTVGLAAWLPLLEALSLAKNRPVYRRLFEYWLRIFAIAILGFLGLAFVAAISLDLRVMHRWLDTPGLALFPGVGVVAFGLLFLAIRRRWPLAPFFCGVSIFAAAFATLAVSFYPYMVPYSITIAQAAAPPSSLGFMFWGAGVFVLPLTLIYTLVVYFVFKGKVDANAEYE
jgi:cytochrome bd-type quinol oxidase subunit 2